MNPNQIRITVRAAYTELSPLLSPAAKKISETIEIEGFRKGYAPYEVVKQKVGEFKVFEEAAKLYIQQNSEKILEGVEAKEFKGLSFEPIGPPEVLITKLAAGEELEYQITLSLLPAFELPDYKSIAARVLAEKKVAPVTEEEVKSSLGWLCESRAKLVTVNRGAKLGDRVEVDFSATLDKSVVEGFESHNHPFLLGRGHVLPKIEEALLGMSAGQEKIFTITLPPDYRDKTLVGKSPEIKARMKLVEERQVPVWSDHFAKSLGNFATAAEAEKGVRQGLEMEHEERERERLRIKMAEEIASAARIEVPEKLISRELEKMLVELRASIEGMGMKFPDYLLNIKKTEEDLKKEWRDDAIRRVRIALVLREIARKERIQPSEDEVEAAVSRTISHRGINEEELKTIDRQAFIEYHVGIARNEKVFQFLENPGSQF